MTESDLSDEDRRLLAEAIAGQRPANDSEVAEVLRRNATARRDFELLQQLSVSLAEKARSKRDEYEEAMRTAPEQVDVARMRALVTKHRQTQRTQRGRRRWALVAAAAVLGVFGVVWYHSRNLPTPISDPRLRGRGSGSPRDSVARYGEFSAEVEISAGTECYFRVFAEVDGELREVASSPRLRVPRWQPDAEQAARIEACAAILWRLEAVHLDRPSTTLVTERASLRR